MASKRVFIQRTDGEMQLVNRRIKELGKSNMTAYIRSELCRLRNKLEECPTSVTCAEGHKKEKVYYLSEYSYQTLELLSIKMKRPIATVFDELLISPLLRPDTLSVL